LVSSSLLKISSCSQRALLGALIVWVATVVLMNSSSIHAQEFIELTPELDARAAQLNAGIMCPICNGQTISQSHTAISETMRQMVRGRLVAGDSNDQIYDFMVGNFGRDILASPPKSGIGLAVWFVPPVALVLGGIAVALFVRRLRATGRLVEAPSKFEAAGVTDGELEVYLRLVDQEMSGIQERP
jgi:cytochrome c-type biogenesis protein CcmH